MQTARLHSTSIFIYQLTSNGLLQLRALLSNSVANELGSGKSLSFFLLVACLPADYVDANGHEISFFVAPF
jgi:hypothetical protein